ncbi:hypothetical protein [Nitrospirillum sp. BR 11163]|uniref:hypothetical protein n=1 Tax=Nitrospirillum sp. BR 11163 TaxID=3104323 RepID=UPI002AFED982|nr:hypothetical protein [Nitrospirillum sp. BR 11163]MEA1674109.1 hypothetical protein [Nitrospirillum sp. BR 11163]
MGQIGITQANLGAGQVVGVGPVGVDNGADKSQATQYAKTAVTAINSAAQTAGLSQLVLTQNSGFLNGNYIETIGGKINVFVDGVKKVFDDGDAAIADFAKRLLQDDHTGTLSDDVKKALENTKATTSDELNSDIAFAKSFRDTLASYSKGLAAADDVQVQAQTTIVSTIQSLEDFRETTKSLGLDTDAANKATSDRLKSILGITPAPATLDAAQQAVAKIDGAVQGALPYLAEFGISIDDVTAAAKNAKAQLLSGTLNDLAGMYLQAGDAAEQAAYAEKQLIAQRAQYLTDVQAEGGGQDAIDQVNKTFARLFQNVVTSAGLSADQVAKLITLVPELTGQVQAYSAAVADATDTTAAAAKAQALAQGKSTYLDALGITPTGVQALTAALSGSSGLDAIITAVAGDIDALNAAASTGADATGTFSDAFNAMTDLLTRGKISASDYTSALGVVTNAYKSSASAASQAASQLYSAGANIQAYIDKTKSGGVASYLSPTDQLSNAKTAYQTQLGLAQAGNSTALGNITQYADTYIQDIIKTMGSGTDTTATINAVLAQLSALPATKSYNDQSLALLGQIAANTNQAAVYLAAADANSDSQITWAEFQTWGTANTSQLLAIGRLLNLPGGGDLASIYAAIDVNGDGTISQVEQTRIALLAGLQGVATPTGAQVAQQLAPYFTTLTSATNGTLTEATFKTVLSGKASDATLTAWFKTLDTNGDNLVSAVEAARAAIVASVNGTAPPSAQAIAGQLSGWFNTLTANTSGLLTRDTFNGVLSGVATNDVLNSIWRKLDSNNDGQISKLELINASTGTVSDNVSDLSGSSSNGNTLGDMITQVYRGNVDRLNIYNLTRAVLDDLNRWSLKITYNTASTAQTMGGTYAYAGGTDYHPGGWAIVGERGPEIAWMPTGTKVWPNGVMPTASNLGATGGGTAGIEARLDRVVAALERLVDQTGQGNDDNSRALSAVAGEVRAVANAVRSPAGVGGMVTIGRR